MSSSYNDVRDHHVGKIPKSEAIMHCGFCWVAERILTTVFLITGRHTGATTRPPTISPDPSPGGPVCVMVLVGLYGPKNPPDFDLCLLEMLLQTLRQRFQVG
mmetsp:Transcript_16482/g.35546  ORF Transcript_16482/g.35546 Transcript_16482/m.35546 type:complete len:102 (+) Transcript_16482:2126-2431(+)